MFACVVARVWSGLGMGFNVDLGFMFGFVFGLGFGVVSLMVWVKVCT